MTLHHPRWLALTGLATALILGFGATTEFLLSTNSKTIITATATVCPELKAGDRFKVAGFNAVYVLNINRERLYFPSSEVYHNWYKNYSGIIEISPICINSYPIPRLPPYGVNYRPGTRLVKLRVSPDVYAITPGNHLAKLGGEEVAEQLYGREWRKLVKDINDEFWPNFVAEDPPLSEAKPHDGMIVSASDLGTNYYIQNGRLHPIEGNLSDLAGIRIHTLPSTVFQALEKSPAKLDAKEIPGNPIQAAIFVERITETPDRPITSTTPPEIPSPPDASSTAPTAKPTSSLPAPSDRQGEHFGGTNFHNEVIRFSQIINFFYDAAALTKVRAFRMYYQPPTDGDFHLAATFDNPAPIATRCRSRSNTTVGTSYSGDWKLEYFCGTQTQHWTVKTKTTYGAAHFPIGEYNFYFTAIDTLGKESAPSPIFKHYVLEPIKILSPNQDQPTLGLPPVFHWTVARGWPSALKSMSYYISVTDGRYGVWLPSIIWKVNISRCQASRVFDGPVPLQPNKDYFFGVSTKYDIHPPRLPGPQVHYISMLEKREKFRVSTSTNAVPITITIPCPAPITAPAPIITATTTPTSTTTTPIPVPVIVPTPTTSTPITSPPPVLPTAPPPTLPANPTAPPPNSAAPATSTPPTTATTTSPADTAPPAVSSISATNITANSATITWTTNEAATSDVRYANNPLFSATTVLISNTSLVTNHSVSLTDLGEATSYYFIVISRDQSGNTATSSEQSFNTSSTPPPAPPSAPALSKNIKWSTSTFQWIVGAPTIASDGTIYVGEDLSGGLHAYDQNGAHKWTFNTDGSPSTPTIDADGTVYVGSWGKNFYAINPNGAEKWRFSANARIAGSAAIAADGTIYFGTSFDEKFYALNPNGTQKWVYSGVGGSSAAPAVAPDGTIYVGASRYLTALNPDGTLKWQFDLLTVSSGGSFYNAPAIGPDGTIYIGSSVYFDSKKFFAINPDGTKKWSASVGNTQSGYYSAAIGADNTIYISSQDAGLSALDSDGTQKWTFAAAHGAPTVGASGLIYIGGNTDNLFYALNPTGSVNWSWTVPVQYNTTQRFAPAIDANGTLYTASANNIYAIESGSAGLANSPWPKFQKNNQNTGR